MKLNAGRNGEIMCRLIVPIWENWDGERLYKIGDKVFHEESGSSYVCIRDLDIVGIPVYDLEFWQIIASGGERGEQGIQGEKGEKGDTGEQGIQGIQGEKGEQGIQGIQGEKGEQGVQGEKGEKGDTGEQGIQGIQGIQGEKGEKGDKGETGSVENLTKEDIITALEYTPFNADNVVNNLTTTQEGYSLDARQGKMLNTNIGEISSLLESEVLPSILSINGTLEGHIVDKEKHISVALNNKPLADANNAIKSGMYFLAGANRPPGATDGALIVMSYTGSYDGLSFIFQIFMDWRTNILYSRRYNNVSWSSWERIVTDKPSPWISATLINGWTGNLYYTKNDIGLVTLRGIITAPNITSDVALLPVGFRPINNTPIYVLVHNNSKAGDGIFIVPDGRVALTSNPIFVSGEKIYINHSYYGGGE